MNTTGSRDDGDDYPTCAEILSDLERELAAILRQYRRAQEANDSVAEAVEVDAVACRIRRMLTIHLDSRIGMSSADWVWLDGDDKCKVEIEGTSMRVSGRIWCSLPEGRREWTEPFAAEVVHQGETQQLANYTIWWGTRATLLDLATVERFICGGETLTPPAPIKEDGWAYVFRMGEASDPEFPDA